jgi:hypothetical protein
VGLPVHVPFAHVSVEPEVVAPLIVGSAVFDGGDAPTVSAADVALPEPPAFVAVTAHRSCVPGASTIT